MNATFAPSGVRIGTVEETLDQKKWPPRGAMCRDTLDDGRYGRYALVANLPRSVLVNCDSAPFLAISRRMGGL